MSCDISAIVAGGPDAEACLDRIRELEMRWSRFIATSEVSELNRCAGQVTPVSRETIGLVEAMIDGWRATDGAFDPTLVGAIVALGYAASRDGSDSVTSLPPSTTLRGAPEDVVVDRPDFSVTLPVGTGIDPGGIGKGLAADLVAREMLEAGATGALVEIGGDISAVGTSPTGDAWTVALRDHGGSPGRRLTLTAGGVATSTTTRRHWNDGDGERHHLVDPSTLDSATTSVVTCTVVAGTATWAEVFTKVAFVVELDEAIGTFEEHGLAALLTLDDGAEVAAGSWKEFER
jgi:thiamine biosynthesis lipoprotein